VTMNLLHISLLKETRVNVHEETMMRTYEANHSLLMTMLDSQVQILERKKANTELPSQHLLSLIPEKQSNLKLSGSEKLKRW
jgi:hypothetical protein